MAKKTPKENKPGQHVIVKLSNGRIEEVRINHVLEHSDGTKLPVDFGHDETALVELWQVIENWKCEGQVPENPPLASL